MQKIKTSILIGKDVWENVKNHAETQGITLGELIRRAISKYIAEHFKVTNSRKS